MKTLLATVILAMAIASPALAQREYRRSQLRFFGKHRGRVGRLVVLAYQWARGLVRG